MDCRQFRREHLAYLDDTLPGNVMAEAQQHIMRCDGCAAHDRLVRRSLMLVHNLPELEPSEAFSARLQARLAACKAAPADLDPADDAFLSPPAARGTWRRRPVWLVMAASVVAVSAVSHSTIDGRVAEPELAPVFASAPPPPPPIVPAFSPAMLQAMSTGNPMWSVVQLLDEMPAHALATSYDVEYAAYGR